MKTKLALSTNLLIVLFLLSCASTQEPEVLSMDIKRFPIGSATLIENKNKDFWVIRDLDSVSAISSRPPRSVEFGCPTYFQGIWDGQKWSTDEQQRLVNDQQGFFVTRCHGSVWDIDGKRVGGPAACDLVKYPVSITDDKVIVEIEKPIYRECFGDNTYPSTPAI